MLKIEVLGKEYKKERLTVKDHVQYVDFSKKAEGVNLITDPKGVAYLAEYMVLLFGNKFSVEDLMETDLMEMWDTHKQQEQNIIDVFIKPPATVATETNA